MKLPASQINDCSFCVDMHNKDARAIGEEEHRLHLVAVWRKAACFSDRERAALAWADAKMGVRRRPGMKGCTTLANWSQQTGGGTADNRTPIARRP